MICETPAPMVAKEERNLPHRSRSRSWSIARVGCYVLLVTMLACGCAKRWNWRGKGFGYNEDAHQVEEMRPPADEKQFSGFDARAQEIERSLGVR